MRRIAALGLLLASLPASAALAQTGQLSPAERRDQLAKVQEMLADPDPLLRLANMEAIVNSGDFLKLQVALRSALSSDDADLRGLAMRAYMATRQEATFDILLPPAVQRQYDATGEDPDAKKALAAKNVYLPSLEASAFRIQLKFSDFEFGKARGTVESGNKGPFNINGDRFSTRLTVPLGGWRDCYIDFRPTRQLTLEGTLACGAWPKLAISTSVF
jgi:hypothetical protein